jgi:NAD(P)H-hydrate epimerase
MIEVTKEILKKVYPRRPPVARKYDYGLLTIIGGSEFYSGSPALSALAAFRAGVDMIHIIAPKRAADIIASFTPDLAAYPLRGDWLTKEHVATLLSMVESAKEVSHEKTAVVIGGGLGRSEETQEAILDFLSQVQAPVVIDADAIHAVGKRPGLVSEKNLIATPHVYEFFVLTGREVANLSESEKIKAVQEEAKKLGITILLKGGVDIISDGKEVALSRTGSSYMTVGGTGDTLAGIAGALLARGTNPFDAVCAAAYINGLAGEIAAKKFGESLMATDLIAAIPEVLK